MTSMTPRWRKTFLAVHVITSVGWIGAVVAFLVLAVAGLRSPDPTFTRAYAIGLGMTGWWAVVPFCFASLLSGVVQSMGTPWGLVRHYWLAIKLLLTALSTVLLMIHMQPTSWLADAARSSAANQGTLIALQRELAVDAAAAIVVLIVATALSTYKPPGLTPWGWRSRDDKATG